MKQHRRRKLILEIPEELQVVAAGLPEHSLRRMVMARLGVDLTDPKIKQKSKYGYRKMFWVLRILHLLKTKDTQMEKSLFRMTIGDLKFLANRIEELHQKLYAEAYDHFVRGVTPGKVMPDPKKPIEPEKELSKIETVKRERKEEEDARYQSEGFREFKDQHLT